MNKYGEVLEDGSLYFVRELPGDIERAWAWIAEGEKRAQWLCGGGDVQRAGETIKFEFQHKNLTPHEETIPEKYKEMDNGVSFDVDVTACEPPHRLVIWWPSPEGSNEIEFRLSEQNGKVKLELIQRGEIPAEHFLGSCAGWHTHLDIMADKMSGETPKPFWSTHEAFFQEYKARIKDHLASLK
ncbi:SRPBCC family protein [Hyphococcus flavus]|uniref:SRPBCC family protein n=1 Tax=Hyphococcus flavus TaxID=1866326 RepID=A0AAF0CI22_9PROT|nr:SRPBCC family protein [Hyphococcus flavus]WDI32442.1 SRPBCC family protein [Hyphococcus flavus]